MPKLNQAARRHKRSCGVGQLMNMTAACAIGFFIVCVTYADTQSNGYHVPELKRNEGFLLLTLDVGGVAPSLEFSKRPLRNVSPTKISLSNLNSDFMILPLHIGTYQITSINAPYYNLPYRLETKDEKRWQFVIQKNSINYIGKLTINKERSRNDVFVELKSAIATDHKKIHEKYRSILNDYPLVSALNVRDDFYQDLKK